jgi:hypothetical protein
MSALPPKADMCGATRDVCFGPKADISELAEISKFLAGNIKTTADKFLASPLAKMKKKNLLHYELYGTSARGEKAGYWRWAIFAGREEKPLEAGFLWHA